MYNAARRMLEKRGLRIARSLVGSYVTSLDMAGCSITVTLLDDEMTGAVGRIRCTRPRCGGKSDT